MRKYIPLSVKKTCLTMLASGDSTRKIYDEYYSKVVENPPTLSSFERVLRKWKRVIYPDDTTLLAGTYDGFIAHDATVQVSKDGEIIQAWIKQKASDIDLEAIVKVLSEKVEKYEYMPRVIDDSFDMLEIPLFDMHWGVAFMDYYESTLNSILDLIHSHPWKRIVIPFGQDFFHNDSIVNGHTTKGTVIEKVDMTRAVKEGRKFMCAIIEASLECADEVRVLYSPGNHDRSISWMFMQVLLERYGPDIIDDTLEYRKAFTYGKNAIMVTHGDSKQATPKNLAHIFPIAFPEEFASATVREVHAGHLHREGDEDVYGVMVRRLSTGNRTDEWSDREDFIGAHKRFMLFEWNLDRLKSIHYI